MDNDGKNGWDTPPSSTLSELDFVSAHRSLSAGGLPVTYGLIGLFAVLYLVSLWISSRFLPFSFTPNLISLTLMGAMNPEEVLERHEWYRTLTATLLHGNILHLVLNSYALLIVGRFLEPLLGKFWYFTLFLVGGLGGSLLGLKANSPEVVSVGASGAIMGLFAVLGMSSVRVPKGKLRTALQVDAVQVLIPSLLPLGLSIGGGKIDYAAHLGGAIAGVLGSLALLRVWRRGTISPGAPGLARGLFFLSVLAYLGAVGDALYSGRVSYQEYRSLVDLKDLVVPNDEYRKLKLEERSAVAKMRVKYPRDPRLLWIEASFEVEGRNYASAEKKLREALAEEKLIATLFPNSQIKERIQVTLAEVLVLQGKTGEGKETAKPFCGTPLLQRVAPNMKKELCP